MLVRMWGAQFFSHVLERIKNIKVTLENSYVSSLESYTQTYRNTETQQPHF